ncbi:MAG: hypothetical protein ATN31_01240 [Candidatus Epulonipiscioides saccharophilum]|nr:MAG: hypothetical protein ATN31_01240 [Epulopiscium sp. AS2M-Bin001]
MKTQINLKTIYTELDKPGAEPILEVYAQYKSKAYDTHNKRPSLIICPGGYYQYTSDREAEPIALKFLSEGYNVFVLRYSVLPVQYPQQLLELAASVDYVRSNAKKYYIDPDNITIAGFSAGGHLCASLATLYDRKFISDSLKISPKDCYPNKLILGYAVIDLNPHTPLNFLLEDLDSIEPSRSQYYTTAISDYVSKKTPPTFIWHTLDDTVVTADNAFLFANALMKNNVPFELHIYPFGTHGLSLANQQTATEESHINQHVASWIDLALEWLKIR